MESKVKLLGHPVHPIFIVFPLGLLILGSTADTVLRHASCPVLLVPVGEATGESG